MEQTEICSQCQEDASCYCSSCSGYPRFCSNHFVLHSQGIFDKTHTVGPLFIFMNKNMIDRLLSIKNTLKHSIMTLQTTILSDMDNVLKQLTELTTKKLRNITDEAELLLFNIDEAIAIEKITVNTNNRLLAKIVKNPTEALNELERQSKLGELKLPCIRLCDNTVVITDKQADRCNESNSKVCQSCFITIYTDTNPCSNCKMPKDSNQRETKIHTPLQNKEIHKKCSICRRPTSQGSTHCRICFTPYAATRYLCSHCELLHESDLCKGCSSPIH